MLSVSLKHKIYIAVRGYCFLNCSALFHGQMLFNRPMVVRMVNFSVLDYFVGNKIFVTG